MGGDCDIGGSHGDGRDVVAVGDDIEVSRAVVSAEASQAILETHAKTKDTVSLTVGNAWVETAYSAIDAADAVMMPFKRVIHGHEHQGAINKGGGCPVGASAVTLANSVAQSAGSVATAGFYGAVSATHEETSETTSTTATQARGAQLVSLNGSTTLDAANDLRIEGSTVAAQQGDVTLKGTEVSIEAAKNTHQTTVRSDHQRTTVEVFNTAGMPTLPTHTQQEFSGDATTITHAQSRVQAGSGKVTIETSGDATVTVPRLRAVTWEWLWMAR